MKEPRKSADTGTNQPLKEKDMIEWVIFIAAAVMPLVVARCIHEMSGDDHE